MLNRSFARARQGGVTLIELMVGLSVGAIVVVGLLVAWSVFVQQNDYLLRSARLNQEVRAIFQVVTQDLRRAVSPVGASSVELVCLNAASGCDPGAAVPEIGDCVVFNTNVDQSDVVDVVVTVPAGYRVRNGVLEMWWPGKRDTTNLTTYGYASSAGQCAVDDPNRWIPIVDSADSGLQNFRLQVAATDTRCLDLYVADVEAAGRCGAAPTEKIEMTLLNVVLSGDARVATGGFQQFSFSDTVKVRNDAVFQ
ncbi:PulJ/GspJ family protein [Hydrogenophaga defluvii]|uniref:Type II secretion system protein J n=1 Tax=Hydrogenophaga defluvii TaxID=249410 RepID=A0ABW2SDG7_9BURK